MYNKEKVISSLLSESAAEISIEDFKSVSLSSDTVLATYISVKTSADERPSANADKGLLKKKDKF